MLTSFNSCGQDFYHTHLYTFSTRSYGYIFKRFFWYQFVLNALMGSTNLGGCKLWWYKKLVTAIISKLATILLLAIQNVTLATNFWGWNVLLHCNVVPTKNKENESLLIGSAVGGIFLYCNILVTNFDFFRYTAYT